MIDREAPDLVVLDRMLPALSGDEVLETMRRGAVTRSVPVLMLTAKREQKDRIEGTDIGDCLETVRSFGYRFQLPETGR